MWALLALNHEQGLWYAPYTMNSALPPDDSINTPSTDLSGQDAVHKDRTRGDAARDLKDPFLATPADQQLELPRLSQKHLGSPRVSWWIPIGLLVATCLSTFFAGSMSWEPHRLIYSLYEVATNQSATTLEQVAMSARMEVLRSMGQGIVYMICVIAILFAHEMGHYVATLYYKIPSTPPFFIPFPLAPIGTMGAVIAMKGQQADRREIFDIGIAGPLAGLVLAVPILWMGVGQLDPSVPGFGGYRYDLPLLVRWMYAIRHPSAPLLTDVTANQVNAMFMAGWVGMLITGLNMMPVSQLDGGHVTYTLFGKHSRWIARAFVGIAISYMVLNNVTIWFLMLILVFVIGIYHPPTSNDAVPLGKWRVALGLASLLIPVLCFPPRGLMPQ